MTQGIDEEIEAMSTLAAALEALPPEARTRVFRWAAERFALPLIGNGSAAKVAAEAPPDDSVHFDDFAALFDRARPRTDAEKALVGAYWLLLQDQKDFRSQDLNSMLKNLGHGVGNITDALGTLQSKKPNEVMQVRRPEPQSKGGRPTA